MMITFPSVKDRSKGRLPAVPEDQARESAQLLCLAKAEWFGGVTPVEKGTISTPAWQHPTRSADYADIKQKWIERLQTALLKIYPQLEGKIGLFDIGTPLTIEHYLPTGSGSAIGLDTSGGEECRFTNLKVMKMLDMRSPVPALWLTGQDALMIGVPLAQAAGIMTALRIVGPVDSAKFVIKTAWLLAWSIGCKFRLGKASK